MSVLEPESLFDAGSHFEVFFARDGSGIEPARVFLEGDFGDRHFKSCKKIRVTVSNFANTAPGGFRDGNRFKHVRDSIYEFRDDQVRLLCAYDGKGRLLLLDGVIKKRNDLRAQDVDRAISILAAHRRSRTV